MKFTTKNIAYLAVLTALSALLNVFASILYIPNTNTQIAFTYIPAFVAGYFFGPGGGFLVGALGDVIGWLISTGGMGWLPLLTLSSGLMGMIPGLVRYIPLKERWHIVISYVITFLVCSFAINTTQFWFIYGNGRTYLVYCAIKVPLSFVVMLGNLVLNLSMMPFFNKLILPRVKMNRKVEKEEVKGMTSEEEASREVETKES